MLVEPEPALHELAGDGDPGAQLCQQASDAVPPPLSSQGLVRGFQRLLCRLLRREARPFVIGGRDRAARVGEVTLGLA
jgi:hypothetical protein